MTKNLFKFASNKTYRTEIANNIKILLKKSRGNPSVCMLTKSLFGAMAIIYNLEQRIEELEKHAKK